MNFLIPYNYLLIQPQDADYGGLAVAEESKVKKGKVVKAASELLTDFGVIENKIKEGDVVYYMGVAEQKIRIENSSYVIILATEIYGVER